MDERLKQIISDILDVQIKEIDDDFGPEDTPNWDSMNNLYLITAIEEEFQIKLSMEDIKSMVSFNEIKKHILNHLNP